MSPFIASLIELLIKGIPEGLLDVFALYVFTKTPFDKKKYFTTAGIFILIVYIIRWLPINYGVNTMLNLLVLIVLFVTIHKSDIKKIIISVIGITVILFISEELNILLLTAIYGLERTAELLTSTLGKTLYGIPSTIFFAAMIFGYYFIKKKRDARLDNTTEQNRDTSS